MTEPRFASALSTAPGLGDATDECVRSLRDELGGRAPDLLLAFVGHHYEERLDGLGRKLKRALGARVLAGCTAESVVGGSREVEGRPALVLFAACLPGTELRPIHLLADGSDSGGGDSGEPGGWAYSGLPEVRDPDRASLLLLSDPFSFPMPDYLARLERDLPGVPAVGGMASGGKGPGQNLLLLGEVVLPMGAHGIVLEGDVGLRTAVSQGCRPVGQPYVVTAAQGHVIRKLGGRGAARAMLDMLEGVSGHDRALFRRGPFLGIAVDATKSAFGPGDLLVRNVMGIYPREEAISVADDSIRAGQSVQFMVRDAQSAGEDLRATLRRAAVGWPRGEAANGSIGALLFTCGGRGQRLFGTPDHDAACLQEELGPDLATAGFFANGEIGPLGGRNFLHGFTAAIALFQGRAAAG